MDVDIEEFVKDMDDCLSAKVDDITVTIGIGGDMLILEQPGDNPDPDTIMIFGKDDGRKMVKLLQTWLDTE